MLASLTSLFVFSSLYWRGETEETKFSPHGIKHENAIEWLTEPLKEPLKDVPETPSEPPDDMFGEIDMGPWQQRRIALAVVEEHHEGMYVPTCSFRCTEESNTMEYIYYLVCACVCVCVRECVSA